MNSINPPSLRSLKAPVVWNEDIYALGRDSNGVGKLFKYSLANNEWSDYSILSSIYASNSVLATYRSKLLLISGKDMTVWEFSSNDLAFKKSNIKPAPSIPVRPLLRRLREVITTSTAKYLIIVYWDRCSLDFVQLFYDGRKWKLKECMPEPFYSYNIEVATDGHALVAIKTSHIRSLRWYHDASLIVIAPVLNFDEEELEMFDIISCAKFDTILYEHNYFVILHNQLLYFVHSQGVIFTSFIQPPIVPVFWGNSGINFESAPHIVGLPDGTMLMMGMVGDRHGSQLDVVKISHKGKASNSI